MKHVSFEEYEAAKAEIIGGVHYIEKSTMENDVIHKTYSTEENGTFYEVNDKGRVEFWSDKHSESRIYDENERATETDKKAGPQAGHLAGGLPGHFGTHQGRAADCGCADGLCVLRMVSEKAGSNHRISDRNGKRHAGSPEMGGQ